MNVEFAGFVCAAVENEVPKVLPVPLSCLFMYGATPVAVLSKD